MYISQHLNKSLLSMNNTSLCPHYISLQQHLATKLKLEYKHFPIENDAKNQISFRKY